MEKLNKKDFQAMAKKWKGTIEYVQDRQDFFKGTYKVRATLYSNNSLCARTPRYYSQYKEKI